MYTCNIILKHYDISTIISDVDQEGFLKRGGDKKNSSFNACSGERNFIFVIYSHRFNYAYPVYYVAYLVFTCIFVPMYM